MKNNNMKLKTKDSEYQVAEINLKKDKTTFIIESDFDQLQSLINIKGWGVNTYQADMYILRGVKNASNFRLESIVEKIDDDDYTPDVMFNDDQSDHDLIFDNKLLSDKGFKDLPSEGKFEIELSNELLSELFNDQEFYWNEYYSTNGQETYVLYLSMRDNDHFWVDGIYSEDGSEFSFIKYNSELNSTPFYGVLEY
jgi:hypothetical protein